MNEDLELNKTTVEETTNHGIQINIEDPEKTAWEMKKTGQAEMGVKIPVDNSKYQIITPDKLGDLKYIFQDILAGDKSATLRPEFKQLGFDKIKKTLEWLANNNDMSSEMKTLLMTQGWRLNFRDKPPTPEEFLTPKYIGDQANTLHPWIKETFLKFFNPLSPYRNLILSSCIGTGKSTLTVLANMYIALQFAFMWAPYKYYGYAPSTQFTIVFGGFSQKKAYELLMGPLLNVLRQADFWQQCRTMDDMIKANKEFNNASGIPCIYWTTAAPTAQPLDSKVYLPDGSYKLMGDIKVGDVVMSPTQGEATVVNIPFHDVADCYEIELEDGRTVRCSDAHLWKVSWEKDNCGNNIWKVVNTKFLLDHPDYEFEIIDLDDCDSTKENNPFYGKKHTDESKQKMSEHLKGHTPWNKGKTNIVTSGSRNGRARKCILLNTGEVFDTITEAKKKYPMARHISECCEGKLGSAGKLNGEKLRWAYYNGDKD